MTYVRNLVVGCRPSGATIARCLASHDLLRCLVVVDHDVTARVPIVVGRDDGYFNDPYRYYNMDQAVGRALALCATLREAPC